MVRGGYNISTPNGTQTPLLATLTEAIRAVESGQGASVASVLNGLKTLDDPASRMFARGFIAELLADEVEQLRGRIDRALAHCEARERVWSEDAVLSTELVRKVLNP